MGAPTTIQEARKQQQEERHARKAKIKTDKDAQDYAAWFASQPQQVERAAQFDKWLAAVKAADAAAVTLGIAEITGEDLEQAKHDHAVAVLVAERSKPGRRSTASSLTAVGGN